MSFFGRLACFILSVAIVLSGCSNEEPVKAQSKEKSVKYTAEQFSQSMKLTQAKSLPVPQINISELKQKEALEVTKMQYQTSFYRGSKYKKQVALTFDDGPDNNYTPKILDILKKEHIKATFFVVGTMAKRYPSSLKRIYDEGHVIGNHSWNHPVLSKLPAPAVMKQIEDTNNVVTSVIGKTPILVRPPYGALNKKLESVVGKKGFKLIYWDVDTLDWNHQSPDKIMATVKKELKKGSIILQHCAGAQSIQATVDVLPKLIAYLRSQGYEFVTIDKMLHTPAYTKTPKLDPKKPVANIKSESTKSLNHQNKSHEKDFPSDKKFKPDNKMQTTPMK
ncbi:polysaccharide deacetylase family protein [Shimazuella sp. AN120528]|uniref:polysaccharide deacetylase family protein n=1 Tax=Shimazuella soli TaxID=1892854 RepID=UPI001F116A85|nr:polysaccharide deacetylase family protein [Shimazuella soli]MCH5584120.1 polysaccharide deacetylase family protein [Shimazuella soli]